MNAFQHAQSITTILYGSSGESAKGATLRHTNGSRARKSACRLWHRAVNIRVSSRQMSEDKDEIA